MARPAFLVPAARGWGLRFHLAPGFYGGRCIQVCWHRAGVHHLLLEVEL